jgi:hypothetical protein
MVEWLGVAADAVEVGIKLADKAVNGLFTPSKKDPPALVGPGLAVGYFYNFLDTIAQQMNSGSISFRPEDGGGDETKFTLGDANIQIIMPSRLDGGAFATCEAEFKQNQKGSVFLNAQNRYYGINYRLYVIDGVKKLTIIDLARPAMALKRFYEDVLHMNTYSGTADPQWAALQKAELSAFEQTLKRLQERGYAILTNKMDIAYRG